MKKNFWLGLFGVAVLAIAAIAQNGGGLDLDYMRWTRAGAAAFRTAVNSSGQYSIQELQNAGVGEVLVIDDASGATGFRALTSTQLRTLAPSTSGQMLMNITTASLCVSSGTGSGAWVYMSTSGVTANRQSCTL